jgi:DNA (cytosine-5)-methyltransferase 1
MDELQRVPGVGEALAALVFRVAPDGCVDPVIGPNPVLRVAARFTGTRVDRVNKRSDGRMAVGRLIGVDDEGVSEAIRGNQAALAHLALLEISRAVCRPERPLCSDCPLRAWCQARPVMEERHPELPFEAVS